MKRLTLIVFAVLSLTVFAKSLNAQATVIDRQSVIDSLTTIDKNIKKYFPRWKICEPDLMRQIYVTFQYRFPDSVLSQQDIEVLAAPKSFPDEPYEILLLSCGKASLNAHEIDKYVGDMLVGFVSGQVQYTGQNRGYRQDVANRDYCYTDIPQEMPLSSSQAETIKDFLQPTNVDHAFTLSLFEQAMKIGETGFWLRSKMGNDNVGYHFWSSGEAKFMLQRPLYVNDDSETMTGIPYLINAHLGGAYRITSGLNNDKSLFSWLNNRSLNGTPDGKLIAGIDFHMPFHPYFGISLNAEVPFDELTEETIIKSDYGMYDVQPNTVLFKPGSKYSSQINSVAPVLRATGQLAAFYHWWLDPENPENYFRFDVGLSYSEVREMAYFVDPGAVDSLTGDDLDKITVENVSGLKTYKPNEFGDWLYLKAEYRNQAIFPFGASIQYSNQILLGRIYIPLFGDWFYLEGKYATPLRGIRPYEVDNFFMISPVIRLTI
jgi:hypothetical protein